MIRNSEKTLTVEVLDPALAGLLQQQVDLGLKALEQNNPDMAITFFQSALSKIDIDFPFYDHITHNLLLGYKQRIEQLLANQRKDEALALLEDALDLEILGAMAEDQTFRRAFADAFQGLGLSFFENLEFEACLTCCRMAIRIKPDPTYHVNLTNALAVLGRPPRLSDFTTRITPRQLGKHVFIACVPKSASTFLKNVLVDLTGYKNIFSVYSSWQTEQELYLPTVMEYADQNTVTQQHCRASEANIQMMQAFGIRPVVLVRNVFDAVISLADFYRQGAYFNSYFRADFLTLGEEKQVDLLIDNIVPWYLQFVASWSLAEKEDRLEIYWLSYEDLIRNKVKSIEQLLEFYGLGAAGSAVERLIAATEAKSNKNRFNIGVAGRGKTGLTNKQKERIIALTEYHPATDFSRIGL
jgi:tetratricopeptide (TPR) repeat protein